MLKVAILKDESTPNNLMQPIIALLNKSKEFISFEYYSVDPPPYISAIKEYKDELKFKRLQSLPPVMFRLAPTSSYPVIEQQYTWEELFEHMDLLKGNYLDAIGKNVQNKIADLEADLTIYLTGYGNDKNWFSGMNEDLTKGFVKTSKWEYFFGNVSQQYPIAFEVISLVYQHLTYANRDEALNDVHKIPRGCLMDLSQNKDDIILKMRSADICYDCMAKIEEKKLDVRLMQSIITIMEETRGNLLFRKRADYFNTTSKIEVVGNLKTIFFVDYGNLEFPLNPKERTVYLFFLNHPEGVRLVDLQDHKEELWELYKSISNTTNFTTLQEAFELLINPADENIVQVLSRIRRKLNNLLGNQAERYMVTGERGGKFAIASKLEVNYKD